MRKMYASQEPAGALRDDRTIKSTPEKRSPQRGLECVSWQIIPEAPAGSDRLSTPGDHDRSPAGPAGDPPGDYETGRGMPGGDERRQIPEDINLLTYYAIGYMSVGVGWV